MQKLLAAIGITSAMLLASVVNASSATAVVWQNPPRDCGSGKLGYSAYEVQDNKYIVQYDYAGRYEKRRSYGGGIEVQTVYIFAVYHQFGLYGFQPSGRADKVCGSRWIPYTA